MGNQIESSKKSQCELKEFASTATAGERDPSRARNQSPANRKRYTIFAVPPRWRAAPPANTLRS